MRIPWCGGGRPPRGGRAAFLLAVALAAGCGGGRGQVSGRVLYKDKPVPGGWVTFVPADSRENSVTVPIGEDGTYEVTLPAGQVQIAVDNRELDRRDDRLTMPPPLPPGVRLPTSGMAGGQIPRSQTTPPRPTGRYLWIPVKYHDIETSGLTYTVNPGGQSFDIELK